MFQSRKLSVLSSFVAVMLVVCLLPAGSVAGRAFPSGEEIANAKAGDLVLQAGTYEIGGKSYRADYGTLVVPENRNKADSRLIQLPVIRIHATGDHPAEPVFLLTGGPGAPNVFSAERLARIGFGDFPKAWLLDHHDFVMVGYRGVDGSVSLNLPEVVEALQVEKNPLSSEILEKLGKAYFTAFQRLKKEGVDIDGYTMVEVIDDMEAARKGLGYEKINLYSPSYGSRVAYIYSLRYPESIHRSLMVSVNPPGHFVWEPEIVDAQLRYYADLWKKDPIAVSRSPDLIKTMQSVLKTLPQEWEGFRIDPDKVKITTFMQLMHRGSAAQVFDAYVAAEKGDYSGLAYLSVAYDKMIPNSSNWGERASKAVSADYDAKRDYEAEMDPAGSIIGSPVSKQDWGSLEKGGWPIKPIAEEYRKLQYSDVETLLVNGSVDFATPAESAKKLLPYLRKGKLVILAEMGHVSDVESIQPEAFQHLVETFYLEGIVDDSKFTYQPMNFTPSQTFQDIAKQFVEQATRGAAGPASAQRGNVYEDPEGRFSIPLVGEWTQIETDGTYALLAFAEPPLDMYIVTAESDDLEAGIDAALRKLDIDPGALTLKDTGKFGNWYIFYYSLGEGKGVTVPAQVKDETTYCLIITGDETLTMNPPDLVVKTVGGFTFAGEEFILPTTIEEFEAYINSFVGDKPPALSIAIALGGDVIYAKGFGMADGPKGMAATPDTVYQWGSMSKMVTATAIMQLREKGLVDLDAPVSQYLDYFPTEYPITVRQLLSHSSGLPEPTDYIPFNLRLEGQSLPDPDLWARRYLDEFTGPMFEPGSASAYSSPNSVILGQIVAEVSGKSYIKYARENILIPLAMKTTDFTYSSEAMISKAAAGAFPADEIESVIAMMDKIRGRGDGADFVREVDGDLAWMNRFHVFAPAGGGLIGPVTEVIRFLGMHLNSGEFEGVRILSPESVSLMQEMGLSSKGTPLGFGLGWEVIDDAEHPYVEHPGSGYGIQDLMRLYPKEGLAIVIMSNLQGYDHEQVVDAAANVIFSMLGTEKKEPDTGQALQGLLDQQVQEQGILGMAMAVRLADGTVIGTGSGYSDPSGAEAWSIDTASAIGSVTKTFTAVVIMQLAEEGKLSIDDTIDTWFPKQPNGDRITIRMLLSHTSGLARYISAENVMEEKWNKKWAPMDLVAEANKSGPVGEPGSSDAHYSNTNYVLLGLIVEEVTGNGWAQEVESRIIKPLGLKDTAFLSKEGILDIMVGGYAKKEVGYQNLLEAPGYPHPSTAWSAGAITSTVSDLITYASALFKDDLFESRETLEEMLQPLASQDFGGGHLADLGLGLMRIQIEGMTIWGHPGDLPGYAAFIGYDPDSGATVAATVNTVGGDVIMPAISALQYVSQIQQGEQVPAEPALAQADNIYEDPEGRFTIPLVGEWIQIETDGTYGKFALTEPPLNMHLVTVESDDLYAGIDAALRKIDIDPAALTPTLAGGSLGLWSVFMYSVGDGQGVTVLAQVKDEVTYAIIATGREDIVARAEPPADVFDTILGFTFSGEELVLPSTVQEFEAYINSFVGDTPPGLSVVISLGGDVLYAKGFGLADGPKGMAATPDTVYQWGSVGKLVTVTAIMQLREKGLVDLDAPISRYLDYFPAEYPITVLQLLNHSAGMPEANLSRKLWNLDGKPLPDPDLAARAYVDEFTGPIFEPGSASAYANPHLLLAGQIVAEVSGKPYAEYARENILTPLGMENTDFTYSSEAMIEKAAAHAVPANQVEGIIAAFNEVWELGDTADLFREVDDRYAWTRRYNTMAAWGGLKGPASEAIRFLEMHLNGGEFNGVRILSPESVSLMQEIQLSSKGDPLQFALGWFVNDDPEHPYVEHAGGGVGIRDLMRLYPKEGLAIVLMSNAGGYDELTLVDAAANVIFSTLGLEKKEPDTSGAPTPTPAMKGNVYQDPEGRFSIPLVGDWTQVETDGTYALLAFTEPPLDMYIVTEESSDLETGIDEALRKLDIDLGALTLADTGADTGKFGNWTIFYYSVGDGKGVTVLAQVKDDTTYCLIARGDEAITMNPPDQVIKTAGGFTLTGEEVILPTTVEEFEAYMATVVGDRPPALSIAIALGDDVIYAKGFGMADGPKGMAATPDTVYLWASMTKIVTATAIMQLYEKGLVDLDAPASHYLDYFPTEYPITVRELLSHSAGLPEPTEFVPFNLRLAGQSLPDPDQVARRYFDEFTGPIFEPGSAAYYANPSSVMLGQIVAEVSGKSYIEYAKENILDPLGMRTTDFTYASEAMIEKAAAGAFPADEVESVIAMMDEVRGRGDGADFIREVDGDLAWMNRFSVFAPHGGLIGPATEVIRFLGMHLNGGKFEGVRILSPESVSLMQEMGLSSKGTPLGFGLGWEVFDDAEHPYVQHPGGGYGSQALMRVYPNEEFAIVTMSNLQGYDYEQVVDAAANVVFSMLEGR